MKINLNDFIKDEDFLENFQYVETRWLIFKKIRTRTLCYERVSLEKVLELIDKNFQNVNEEIEQVLKKKKEMVNDLFRVLKNDKRNFWLKKDYLNQQPIEHLTLIIGIICRELLSKSKKKTLVRKSPLERFLDSL